MQITKENAYSKNKTNFGHYRIIKTIKTSHTSAPPKISRILPQEQKLLEKMRQKLTGLANGRKTDLHAGISINPQTNEREFFIFASRQTNSAIGRIVQKLTGEGSPDTNFGLPRKILRKILRAEPTSGTLKIGVHRTEQPLEGKLEEDIFIGATAVARDYKEAARLAKIPPSAPDRNLQQIRNFKQIDRFVARGGQPQTLEQLDALKNAGYTHVISFRTYGDARIDFDEAEECQKRGMEFVGIPLMSKNGPTTEDLTKFFGKIEEVRKTDKKAYIHCAWGEDRTGFMSACYKLKYGLGKYDDCMTEMVNMGHNYQRHVTLLPLLRETAREFLGIKNT